MGGAGSIDARQRFLLARSVLPAWGEPAPPGLPPEGETGKGRSNSLLPQAISAASIGSDLMARNRSFEGRPHYRFRAA